MACTSVACTACLPTREYHPGSGWTEAALIVSISSLASLFWFPVILTYPLLMALGANREAFISNLISRLVATAILCFAALHGLLAVALSQFISLPFQMVVAIVYVRKHTKFSYRILEVNSLKVHLSPYWRCQAAGYGCDGWV